MKIIDGKVLSLEIIDNLKPFFLKRKTAFVVVSIGDNAEASESFIREKKKIADLLGIEFLHHHFLSNVSNTFLRKKIGELAKGKNVKGIIVQLPIPKELNLQYILNAIPVDKDPDVLTEKNLGAFIANRFKILPLAAAVLDFIFKKYQIEVRGKNCVVVGSGRLVGMPIFIWLKQKGATVSVVDEFTKNPEDFIKQADIVISGVGKPKLITGKMIKDDAIIIDFGYCYDNGKLVGDIDFDSVSKRASLVTPTPGGTGPILVAQLYNNLKILIETNAKKR